MNDLPDMPGKLIAFMAENEPATLSIHFDGKEWLAALTFGQEAPDSPMAAGEAYGFGNTLNAALEGIGQELHIP